MKLKLLLVILALQCAWILGTTFQQERVLRVGKTVLLETQPVDPRDLLRGDFVILNYTISTLPGNVFTPPLSESPPAGQTIYVALEQRGKFHVAVRADTSPFEPASDQVLIMGQSQPGWRNDTNSVRVEYGLERYYVAEGTGNPGGKLTVQAVVPVSGRALIKQVFVDGAPYAEAMRERDAGR
ncbi:MAG TPA: GDYXXLXY domain-containing protein [Verrucomicrobiota bacterium]|nr:GDYXXLXY domain-containing protein [Verrucomicrobiota bacterium]